MTTTKRLAAACSVIALLVLAAWVVTWSSQRPAAPRGNDATDRSEHTSVDPAGERPAAAPSRMRRRASDEATTTDIEPVEISPRPSFVVRVLGPGDVPVPGVVFVSNLDDRKMRVITDRNGEASFPAPSAGSSRAVWAPALESASLSLTEDLTVLRYDDLVPLEIVFVDLENGYPIAVATHAPILGGNEAGPTRESVRIVVAPVRPGATADFAIGFDAPAGYVHPGEGATRRSGHISRYADEVRATVPVPRELSLRVLVRRADGTPAPAASVSATVTGFDARTSHFRTGPRGWAVVRGAPFLRGETVRVVASDGHGRVATAAPVVLVDDAHELVVEVDLPDEPNFDAQIGIGGGAGGAFGDRRGGRGRMGTGELIVSACRRNGLPAAGATLILGGPRALTARTDESGAARFTSLTPGSYSVTLREPGLITTSIEVELADGERSFVTLREKPGRNAAVTVKDQLGRPVPCARLEVMLPHGERHIQLVDSTQEFDLLTDLAGGCSLVGLPAAPATVRATFGSRSAHGTLVEDTLVLVLSK